MQGTIFVLCCAASEYEQGEPILATHKLETAKEWEKSSDPARSLYRTFYPIDLVDAESVSLWIEASGD